MWECGEGQHEIRHHHKHHQRQHGEQHIPCSNHRANLSKTNNLPSTDKAMDNTKTTKKNQSGVPPWD